MDGRLSTCEAALEERGPFLAFTVAPFGTWHQILAARIELLHVKLSRANCLHACRAKFVVMK
jgi:hypothetical protein